MVPDKFNMVDMGGIDLIMMQGEEVPGLYMHLVESIAQCRYQCLYNWLFDGVIIPPTYVELRIGDEDEVVINEGITVTDDDVIHIYSIQPPAPEPEIIPLLAEENGTYSAPVGKDGFNPVTVNVPSYTPVINPLSVTENGTYNTPTGVDGYSPIIVNVSGGDEGPIYSGTSIPSSSIGNNEDLYIQYESKPSLYDHLYGIVAEYRKVNGAWIPYTKPVPNTHGVHFWTHNIGGSDASIYIQEGYWDVLNNTFVPTGEIEDVLYTSVRSWSTAKDCYGLALLAYVTAWQIKASVTLTDGTSTYQADTIAATWVYTQQQDIYLWTP